MNRKETGAVGGKSRWNRGMVHFLIAAGILILAASGWEVIIKGFKIPLDKKAVPWPANVQVNATDFYLESLPEKLGHYVLAQDGELFEGKKDGVPDGLVILKKDVMETLGVGTGFDKKRYPARESNWYFASIYVDQRRKGNDPFRYWQLEITYYTGGLDLVPHVPDICLVAGGATLLGNSKAMFTIPTAPAPWDEPLTFVRVGYELPDDLKLSSQRYVQYYIFSLNGQPETSRNTVRLKLANPFGSSYSYFAKIQFAPRGAVTDTAQADAAAEEFLLNVLPSVLAQLPLPREIEELTKQR